jgi:hypothetical protein
LEIAKRFAKDETINFLFDVCGTGADLDALRFDIEPSNLG